MKQVRERSVVATFIGGPLNMVEAVGLAGEILEPPGTFTVQGPGFYGDYNRTVDGLKWVWIGTMLVTDDQGESNERGSVQ